MDPAASSAPNAPVQSGKGTMAFRVALTGNPNCGKTTIFNALTGLHYKVANYPGVTVERKSGIFTLSNGEQITVVDLPGIYSLSGNSIDEKIATDVLLGALLPAEPLPDLIVAVIDSSNLERNLYLTSQLIDLGIPTVIALNMIDVATDRGFSIKGELLASEIGALVVPLSADRGQGLNELKTVIESHVRSPGRICGPAFRWMPSDSSYRRVAEDLGLREAQTTVHPRRVSHLLIGAAMLSNSFMASNPGVVDAVEAARVELEQQGIDAISFEATHRYGWINALVRRVVTQTEKKHHPFLEKIDHLVTHRFWGSVIFFTIMTLIFQAIFLWASAPMDLIEQAIILVGDYLRSILPDGQIESLVVDGIVAGVGSVLVFVPQIAILFLFLGILEETGYLCRAAFLMDRVMRKVGLQGRSFIPLLSSFACAIPGIMATRSIPSLSDRIATILVAPLMSCSARLPVYTLLIAAFVPDTKVLGLLSLQGLVLLSMYLLGIVGAAAVSFVLKKTILRGEPALFVMEMPPFRLPNLKVVFRDVFDRIRVFLGSAGTVILACSVILWFLASYPGTGVRESFAGMLGTLIEPVLKPLGLGWEVGIAILTSFAAREVFVTSLATVYNLESTSDVTMPLTKILHERMLSGQFSFASALALMVFYVYACQCMSTVAVCRRETGSWRWASLMFLYMTVLAYVMALITYWLAKIWWS